MAHNKTDETPDFPLTADDDDGEGRPAGVGSKPAPGLYLVATPIGNMGDITLRAIETLRAADVVACEDTRVTGRLLTRLGLHRPLLAYHDHNAERAGEELVRRLSQGAVVALVSDAGTPLVSDPGFRLVRACVEAGVAVTAVPGASAALTALQLSALPSDRFLFAGFLPNREQARRQALRELAQVPATLIFYESPNRLGAALADMAAVLGPRPAAMTRELTKLFEQVVRADLAQLADRYASETVKGEVVIVVGPPAAAAEISADTVEARLRAALAEGASVKDAAAQVAAETGHPRRDVYGLALRLDRTP